MQRGSAKLGIGVLGVAALVVLGGCSQDSDDQSASGDQSASEGQSASEEQTPDDLAAYACALVGDVDGSAQDWDLKSGGDDENASSLAAAADLLGVPTGSPLEGYEDLFESAQSTVTAMQQVDIESLEEGVNDLRDSCAEANLPEDDVDTSTAGRTDYACTLIGDVHGADSSLEDWASGIGEGTPSTNARIFTEAFGAVSLLGAPSMGGRVGEDTSDDDFSSAAQDLREGLARLDADRVDQAIDALDDQCSDR